MKNSYEALMQAENCWNFEELHTRCEN